MARVSKIASKAVNLSSPASEGAGGGDRAGVEEKPVLRQKKKKGASPTALALAECRKRGWLAQKVEQTVAHTFIKRDLFGFGDVLVLDTHPDGDEPCFAGAPRLGSLLVQVTSGAHAAERATKIKTECRDAAIAWLERGNRIAVWSFAKQGAAGKRKLWKLRVVPVTLEDFATKE